MSTRRVPSVERTLVVVCPDWPVTAAGFGPNDLVAVTVSGMVVAVSRATRACGVRTNQRQREAVSCCPGLVVRAEDPGGESRAFELVAAALSDFGADVVVDRPGWAAFPVRGPARYFGGEESLAASVGAALDALANRVGPCTKRTGVAEHTSLTGSWWRIGIADGRFAATLAARCGEIVPANESAAFLAPFGVECLERPELSDLLGRLGVTTLGAFAALDEADVLARFGRDGARAHLLARGKDGALRGSRRNQGSRSVETVLEQPASAVEAAAFCVRELAERLAGELAEDGLACTLVEIEVELSGGERLVRRWVNDAAVHPALVVERLRLQMEAWITQARGSTCSQEDEGGGVIRLRLDPIEVTPDVGRQLELWGRRGDPERAARALARVQSLLGAEEVVFPLLVGGRGPKERVRLVPAGDPLPDKSDAASPWPGQLPPLNPTVVFANPPPAELLDARGNHIGVDGRGQPTGKPASLAIGRAAAIQLFGWAGPWPIDERWWDRRAQRRRARFQVVTEAGHAHLVSLERGGWIVEGTYD
ncbi:MAG: DNA polymerase Y family protein [Acidimicrobiales bacterium]